MRELLLIAFILFPGFLIHSQTSIIRGSAPSYGGDELNFFRYKNYITYTIEQYTSCKVNKNGDFSCEIDVSEIAEVFLETGIFKGYLFVEPGKEYEIELPIKIEKTKEDELNPFFQPLHFHIEVKNSTPNDLNTTLAAFNDTFYSYYDQNITKIVTNPDFETLENSIGKIYRPFENIENTYTQSYMNYKFGLLRHLAHQFRIQNISNSYFLNKPVLYSNPAYMELFNQVYDRYFMFYGRSDYGNKIHEDIAEKSYLSLMETLGENKVLANDTLKEFVVLKNLYDGFYTDDYSRSALLAVLDSLIEYTPIIEHREIGLEIREKVTKLMKGYIPPQFELYNEDEKLVSLKSYKGDYVYLNFCTSASYSCLREYELLKDLYNRHKKRIRIITIVVEDDFQTTLELKKNYDYNWDFLHYGNQPDVINDYDIRAYPTYYFIGPDGKLLLSPSPSPMENFEFYLFKILKQRGDL